jgi:hypothetical protein
MTTEDKLDIIIRELATNTEATKHNGAELQALKEDFKPVQAHVQMVQGVIKAIGIGVGIGGLAVTLAKAIWRV